MTYLVQSKLLVKMFSTALFNVYIETSIVKTIITKKLYRMKNTACQGKDLFQKSLSYKNIFIG